jgi:hypothetical protein
MACLYNPYSVNLVFDGGFCDPVRILLTVLSAWLKTRSTQHPYQQRSFPRGTKGERHSPQVRIDVPTESDITSAPPPTEGSCKGGKGR